MDDKSKPPHIHRAAMNGSLEIIRVLSLAGVVWFHQNSLPYREVGYSGLIALTSISAALSVKPNETAPLAEYLRKRATRLLAPWVLWFFLYGLADKFVGANKYWSTFDSLADILAGPWIGLWFLPFAFVFSVIAFSMSKLSKVIGLAGTAGLTSVTALALLFIEHHIRSAGNIPTPWAQWLHALPAVFFGFSLTFAFSIRGPAIYKWIPASCVIIYPLFTQCSDMNLSTVYIIGTLAVSFAFLRPIACPAWLQYLGGLGMGIYLVHGAFISVIHKLMGDQLSPLSGYFLVLFFSFGASALLKKSPLLQKIH